MWGGCAPQGEPRPQGGTRSPDAWHWVGWCRAEMEVASPPSPVCSHPASLWESPVLSKACPAARPHDKPAVCCLILWPRWVALNISSEKHAAFWEASCLLLPEAWWLYWYGTNADQGKEEWALENQKERRFYWRSRLLASDVLEATGSSSQWRKCAILVKRMWSSKLQLAESCHWVYICWGTSSLATVQWKIHHLCGWHGAKQGLVPPCQGDWWLWEETMQKLAVLTYWALRSVQVQVKGCEPR